MGLVTSSTNGRAWLLGLTLRFLYPPLWGLDSFTVNLRHKQPRGLLCLNVIHYGIMIMESPIGELSENHSY